MDLSNPLGSLLPSNEARVLRVLARLEAPISGRQVHALAGEGSYSGIRLALERLSASGLVHSVVTPSSTNYSINRRHLLCSPVLEALDSRSRLLRLIQEHLGFVPTSDAKPGDLSLSLYGSVARGDSHDSSDIDIVVIYRDDDQKRQQGEDIDALLPLIELWTGSPAQLYDVTRSELKSMVMTKDPIIDSWFADSVTVVGPSVSELTTGIRG
jgi:predicted nucleotidyltransferase